MKRCVQVFIICWCAFQFANGQAQDLKVKLRPKPIEIAGRDFIISKTIDARRNKMMLGTVKRGLKQRSRIASLHKGLEFQFNTFLAKSLPAIEKYNYEILLVVRELTVAESSLRYNQAARVTAMYDFYLQVAGEYKMLCRSEQFLKNTSGIDVTSTHDRLIVESIVRAIKEINHREWRDAIEVIDGETYAEMVEPRSFEYPILSANKLVNGIYMNLDQFRKNEPTFRNFKAYYNPDNKTAEPERSGGGIIVYDKEGNPRKITWRIWGFCLDDKLFIRNSNGDFAELVHKGNDFYFRDFIRLSENSNNQAIRGLLGEHKDYVIFKLDIKSGEFIFVSK